MQRTDGITSNERDVEIAVIAGAHMTLMPWPRMPRARTTWCQARPWFASLIAAVLFVSGITRVTAADAGGPSPQPSLARPGLSLLMIEEDGCSYCRRWHAEVGPGYPLSSEGKSAPLVVRDRFDPQIRGFGRIVYTPTFILIENGEERGRILGYPGADFFWTMIGDLIERARRAPAASAAR
jgi:hypothetical protein